MKKDYIKKCYSLLLVNLALVGCQKEEASESVYLQNYIDFISREDIRQDTDFLSAASSGATEEHISKYCIEFLDEKYISFRAEEYSYSGGAHGYNKTTFGTINRETGKRMCLADFVSSDKQSKLKETLRAKVVQKIGGEENLLGEVKVIENFCVVKDGLKFVYNPYEVASYSMGAIEVVVPFEELK
jgi:stalled ribosome rescue protein Dom34